jgi:FtsH-binding integral membrane protein
MKHATLRRGLMRVAGGLLIAESVVIFIYPQVWLLNPQELADDANRLSYLWFSIPIALVVGLPPLLVGIGVLRRDAKTLNVFGIVMAFVYAASCGQMLTSTSGGFTALWVVVVVTSIIAAGALATAVFLGGRSGSQPPVHSAP